MLAIHAVTSVVISQGSLSHCRHARRFGRRTDRRSALVKAGICSATIDSGSSVSAVLPEDERDAGKSGGTPFVLVKAGDGIVAADSKSSITVVLPENKRDARRCKPCLVFSQ